MDMQAACIEEAVLVQRPLLAVQSRLSELLEEWPDHPVLAQLSAIVARVLGMPVTCPLKQLLTGVELLLARAQVRGKVEGVNCCLRAVHRETRSERPPNEGFCSAHASATWLHIDGVPRCTYNIFCNQPASVLYMHKTKC